ncbi:MAG: AI-2E family transporter [Ginsengibacter sp.]
MVSSADEKYKKNVRLIFIAAAVIMGLWFAFEIINVLFLFFFAVVITLVLNTPTMWLVSKNIKRPLAALIVFFIMLLFLFFIAWLVIPRILSQITSLVSNLPDYYFALKEQLNSLLKAYPDLQNKLLVNADIVNDLPSTATLLTSVSRFSFSIIGGLFLLVVFFSIIVYMLINPAPLVETYLLIFPKEKREKAANALATAAKMMVGWVWSNLIVGIIEAIAVFIFLSIMGVPGVWVWAGLTLFAEMIPKLGFYLMAIPPTLVALSIHPMTALWVLVFYIAFDEISGDFLMPKIRAKAMNLHPVSTLFVMLAMASAFGVIGALIATPLTAFIKAYYETFILAEASKSHLEEGVDVVLTPKTE